MTTPADRARQFIEHEQAFRLGALLTERPHDKTRGLAESAKRDPREAVRMIQSVDAELPAAMKRVFEGEAYVKLVAALTRAATTDRRVFFTGCGATGRLSILLETAWRRAAKKANRGDLRRVFSVMAGGDFALIRSVEGYEDFPDFGKHQLTHTGPRTRDSDDDADRQHTGPRKGDVVVAITEGGETPFVIGTAWAGLDAGAEVFFVFNNPADVLREHVERSRRVLDEPGITCIDLSCAPMAVAGSTRMQATTTELLVVGSALEQAFDAATGKTPRTASHYLERFTKLIEAMRQPATVDTIASLAQREHGLYQQQRVVTYFADDLLLDILTDTTERSPTFSLPAFRRTDQPHLPDSWAFVKNPLFDTPGSWERLLARPVRAIDWTADDYRMMGAPEAIVSNPPMLDRATVEKFPIGGEPATHREGGLAVVLRSAHDDEAFLRAADEQAGRYRESITLSLGVATDVAGPDAWSLPMVLDDGPMCLETRLLAKLTLNSLSTVTMAMHGRLVSNWMVYVSCTNKKLIDRGTRLIADQTGLGYEQACTALFEAAAELAADPGKQAGMSPVALVIERCRTA